jgi:hypothetical protein
MSVFFDRDYGISGLKVQQLISGHLEHLLLTSTLYLTVS